MFPQDPFPGAPEALVPPHAAAASAASPLLANLNDEQLAAVTLPAGHALILAGAGSGKTRVITMKIAHMIEKGMDPKRIAAITFTNKAASEMRERAQHLIGRRAKDVLVCTFHALGVRMVREDGHVLGSRRASWPPLGA
eukprot:gene3380-4351_t